MTQGRERVSGEVKSVLTYSIASRAAHVKRHRRAFSYLCLRTRTVDRDGCRVVGSASARVANASVGGTGGAEGLGNGEMQTGEGRDQQDELVAACHREDALRRRYRGQRFAFDGRPKTKQRNV